MLQDIRYGIRQLLKDPVFTIVAAASLALGIGANTAIFQLVNAIRLKSLPVRDPQELVSVDFTKAASLGGNWSSRSARLTYSQFDQIRQNQQGFVDVLAWSAARFNLAQGGEPHFVEGLYVSGNFFQQLGVNASLGQLSLPKMTIFPRVPRAPCSVMHSGSADMVGTPAFWPYDCSRFPPRPDHRYHAPVLLWG